MVQDLKDETVILRKNQTDFLTLKRLQEFRDIVRSIDSILDQDTERISDLKDQFFQTTQSGKNK